MRISNYSVLLLAILFIVIGPFVLPFDTYLWQLLALVIALVAGFIANMAGAMGAGDAKFIAAAAPYLAYDDLTKIMTLFAGILLAATATHRGVKRTPLRRLAPDWDSWDQGKKFPMGFALGTTLSLYLVLGAVYGS